MRHWTGPEVKITWDCWPTNPRWNVLVYGNPFHSVYQGRLNDCLTILEAFVKVGYKNVTSAKDVLEGLEAKARLMEKAAAG